MVSLKSSRALLSQVIAKADNSHDIREALIDLALAYRTTGLNHMDETYLLVRDELAHIIWSIPRQENRYEDLLLNH